MSEPNFPEYARKSGKKVPIVHFPETAASIEKVINSESEVYTFPGQCAMCNANGEERMVHINIPYFKEVVVMSFTCDECGYKNNEVKAGGAISQFGQKISVYVSKPEDLTRDILKSETAGVEIPELELTLEHGSLGGRFTSVEGLVSTMRSELQQNPFICGDSANTNTKEKFSILIDKFNEHLTLQKPFTLIIDDPLGNSFVQNLFWPEPDPKLKIEQYKRSFEMDEQLGLNDIDTGETTSKEVTIEKGPNNADEQDLSSKNQTL